MLLNGFVRFLEFSFLLPKPNRQATRCSFHTHDIFSPHVLLVYPPPGHAGDLPIMLAAMQAGRTIIRALDSLEVVAEPAPVVAPPPVP
jgi:hypothetical protein